MAQPDEDEIAQQVVCKKYGLQPVVPPAGHKVGFARNTSNGLIPINGLRHPPEGDSTGWYMWAGDELSEDPAFFEPLHVEHIKERCADVVPYLLLPPGTRFLIAPGQEDVWQDASLLRPAT